MAERNPLHGRVPLEDRLPEAGVNPIRARFSRSRKVTITAVIRREGNTQVNKHKELQLLIKRRSIEGGRRKDFDRWRVDLLLSWHRDDDLYAAITALSLALLSNP